jgi:hypothetical protein
MTELYEDPSNIEGTTYGKRWRRHEWIQIVEVQATDDPERQKIALAVAGVKLFTTFRARLRDTELRKSTAVDAAP